MENDRPTSLDILPQTIAVTTTEPLSIEQRLENIERAMRRYIDNPPPLPDAERLSKNIAAVEGKADSALAQIAAVSDTLPQRVGQLELRASSVEQNVQRIAIDKGVALIESVRDIAHETAHTQRNWKCPQCGSGTSDVVRAAATSSGQKSCGQCGGKMIITGQSTVPATDDGV